MQPLLTDPNYRVLARVDTLLIIWLMMMSNYTSFIRLRRKVFATPEDYRARGLAADSSPAEAVERSRRMHQNQLENIPAFLVLSVLYTWTEPAHSTLSWLLWTFLGARVLYTFAYMRALQPHRTIAYAVGALAMSAMAILTIIATL